MRRLAILFILLLIAAGASAQEYVVGGYYEPYGVCTVVETTTVETVAGTPYGYYGPEEIDCPSYHSAPVYYGARPYYHCWPWRARYGYWRDRRDYRRWCRDMRRCIRRCCD